MMNYQACQEGEKQTKHTVVWQVNVPSSNLKLQLMKKTLWQLLI